MKRYEFQVNLHFTDKQVSACGYSKVVGQSTKSVVAVFARSLSGIPAALKKKTGLQLEQIRLTFQPFQSSRACEVGAQPSSNIIPGVQNDR